MKRTLLSIIGALLANICFAQCLISDILPVKHGMTKFQAINALNLGTYTWDVKDSGSYWRKLDYLPGDSVYSAQINCKISDKSTCIRTDDNRAILTFSDDKLYKITVRFWFRSDELSTCISTYQEFANKLVTEYPYTRPYVTSNEATKEQTGEGYWLYKSEDGINTDKIDKIEVGYEIEYKMVYNSFAKKYERSGEVDRYLLEISYIDLNNTKLDRRGY